MMRTTRVRALAALGLGAAIALAGCGSSSSHSASNPSSSGTSSGATTSGIQATIMVLGDFTSTIPFTVPEIAPTVKGVLRGLPKVTVDTCDSKGTAAGFLTCEHTAVADHVAAVIEGFNDGSDQSYLAKAGIPVIGYTSATATNSYPTTEANSLYNALGVGLAKTGCTKLGTIYLDGSGPLIDFIKKGFEASGGTEVARAAVAANAADLAPAVAKITGAGATCVAVSDTPAGAAQALTALKQSGKTLTIGGISAIFSQQLITALGPLTNGLLVVDSELNPQDSAAGVQQVAADEKASDPKAPLTAAAISSWISARIVAAALPKVQGTVTSASLTTAINGLRNVDMDGVIPPWSTVPLNSALFPRIFNHYGINYVIQNSKPVKQGDFYDTAATLQGN